MPRPIGLLASALSPDLREALKLARDLGFAGVQWPINSGGLKLTDLSISAQRDIRAILSRESLRLLSLTTTCGPRGFSPGADIDRLLAHLAASIKAAADLGCPILCADIGPLPLPQVEVPKPKEIDPFLAGAILIPDRAAAPVPHVAAEPRDEAFESLLAAGLAEVGQLADRFGIVVAWRSELGALGSLHAGLRSARCPLFTLDLDPAAILRDAWDLHRILSEFAGQVGHVRLRDALKGSGGRTQPMPLGQGHANLSEVFRSLNDAHYAGPLTIDPTELPNRSTEAASGLKLVQSLVGP